MEYGALMYLRILVCTILMSPAFSLGPLGSQLCRAVLFYILWYFGNMVLWYYPRYGIKHGLDSPSSMFVPRYSVQNSHPGGLCTTTTTIVLYKYTYLVGVLGISYISILHIPM
jgi:hypothetical protein